MGKGWAKGLTAATDARVARNAAAHRGKKYVRRTRPAKPLETINWTDEIAYAVGLIATDGCLVSGRRRVDFVSCDRELAEALNASLGLATRVRENLTRRGTLIYRLQISNPSLYCWLISIGLMPRKSLVLAGIDVPEQYLLPLVRGLLDGDGTIINNTTRADTGGRPGYLWEYFQTKFVSASRAHLEWLRGRLQNRLGISGYLQSYRDSRMSELRFGKRESQILLDALYADPRAPRLERKWLKWEAFRSRLAASRYNEPPSPGGVTVASHV